MVVNNTKRRIGSANMRGIDIIMEKNCFRRPCSTTTEKVYKKMRQTSSATKIYYILNIAFWIYLICPRISSSTNSKQVSAQNLVGIIKKQQITSYRWDFLQHNWAAWTTTRKKVCKLVKSAIINWKTKTTSFSKIVLTYVDLKLMNVWCSIAVLQNKK